MSKVTVITGGTSGIGRGIVEKILANSAEDDLIFATYAHNAYKANEFWDNLKPEDQEKLIILKADMSSYDDMMNFVGEVKEKAGHVDWLISNAGISTYDKFQDYTFEEWNNIVNTNLSVPVFMVKEFMPVMTEGGRVLFMGSYAGQQAYSSSLVYGVTKAAIHFLTKSLVKEFEPKGITVNAIAPGFIQTPWHENRTPESYERINRKIALHRFGEIKDVADMAYSILTNNYMNGSIVDIHGGYDFWCFGCFSVCKCNNLIIICHLRFRFIVIFPNITFAFDKRRVFLLFDNLPTGPYNEIQDITASL